MGPELDVLVVEPDLDGACDGWRSPAEEESGNSPQRRLHAVRRMQGGSGEAAVDRDQRHVDDQGSSHAM